MCFQRLQILCCNLPWSFEIFLPTKVMLNKRTLNYFVDGKAAYIVSKRGSQSRIFFSILMLVGIYQAKSMSWLLCNFLGSAEGKCQLCHFLYDTLENINSWEENEVFLLFYYSKSHIIFNIYFDGTWFLLYGMWLLLLALWAISMQRSLDGADSSLVHSQPSQIKSFFCNKKPYSLST